MNDKRAGLRVVCCMLAGASLALVSGCGGGMQGGVTPPIAGLPAEANRLIQDRGLAPDDCFSDAFRLAPHREQAMSAADLVRLGGNPS